MYVDFVIKVKVKRKDKYLFRLYFYFKVFFLYIEVFYR